VTGTCHAALPYPHEGGCAGCRDVHVCNVCGKSVLRDRNRCTNGRCDFCHRHHCTVGKDFTAHGYGNIGTKQPVGGTS